MQSTAGSDAHRLEQLGTVATRFERKIGNLEEFIEEIKAGRFLSESLA